ncbi:hypothetical protein NL108_010621 [Boleophthalmus pectinirostris]|nr:hypothetical protein NL108_010621 [Boleophthalmus pectinirostris]
MAEDRDRCRTGVGVWQVTGQVQDRGWAKAGDRDKTETAQGTDKCRTGARQVQDWYRAGFESMAVDRTGAGQVQDRYWTVAWLKQVTGTKQRLDRGQTSAGQEQDRGRMVQDRGRCTAGDRTGAGHELDSSWTGTGLKQWTGTKQTGQGQNRDWTGTKQRLDRSVTGAGQERDRC